MNDLVFAVNLTETKKNGVITVDSYLCSNKSNKKNKYNGGQVRKVNIRDLNETDNYSTEDLSQLRNFAEHNVFGVTFYQYIVLTDPFFSFYETFDKGNFYFYTNQIDMYKINRCYFTNEYDAKGKDVTCSICGYDLFFDIKISALVIKKNEDAEKKIVTSLPRIKVITENNKYRLVFEYQGIEVPYNSKDYYFDYSGNIIVRNYECEKKLEKKFILAGFKKKKENTYEYVGNNDPIKVLHELDFTIEREIANNKNEIQVQLSKTDYDWFDLKLTYKLGDEFIDLGDKIDLLSNRKTVTVNGSRIEIPKSIIENAEKIEIVNNRLRVPASNLWTILQIAQENNIDLGNYVSFNDIHMVYSDIVEKQIMDYQKEGARWLKWLYKNKIGGCLADDMGVGKTFQTIAFLTDQTLKDSITKVLIIVPYVLLANWEREFQKFSDEPSIMIYHGKDRDGILETIPRILITTYTTAMNDIEILDSVRFDVIIFDEIQYLKNNNSKTYKALNRLASTTRIGLSGTPLENRIDELWNILNILNPGMMLGKKQFLSKYKNGIDDELHVLLNPFIMRRRKEDVLDQLPEKQEEIIFSCFSEKQKLLYDSIRSVVKKNLLNYSWKSNAIILSGLTRLRQVCCHPQLLDAKININHISESCKFDTLQIGVKEIVESGNKVIIYSQFVEMLKIIDRWCEKENYKTFHIYGDTRNRQSIIDDFEQSEQGIFLISLKAGGVGLNLISAHYAIIYDPWWNPFAEQQASDRIYRIGQKHNVTIFKMVVADSIEEKILNMQESKRKLFADVFDGISNEKMDLKQLIELL